GELRHRRLGADALRSAAAVGRRDHPDGRTDLRRDDDRQNDLAAVSGSGVVRSGAMRSSTAISGTPRRLRAGSLASVAAVGAAFLAAANARAAENADIVLTGTQATYSLATALTQGTEIEVR